MQGIGVAGGAAQDLSVALFGVLKMAHLMKTMGFGQQMTDVRERLV
jgi:hypothetical protein